MSCYCLGSGKPRMRFDDACTHNIKAPPPPAVGPCAFYTEWIASGRDCARLYWVIMVPLYYLFGLLYVVLKVLLLNPPFLRCLMAELRFESDPVFPGATPEERMKFAKRWYSAAPRRCRYAHVASRFTHLPHRHMWMEQFAFFPWLVFPPQSGEGEQSDDGKQWFVQSQWWTPHVLVGWVVVGENPAQTGWLITGQCQCWGCLRWLYKWMLIRVLEWYGDQLARPIRSGVVAPSRGMG